MRQIDDYFKDIPKSLTTASLTKTKHKTGGISIINRILRDKKASGDDYKGDGDVRKKLGEIFHNRCAYCEKWIERDSDIEHFRPKSIYYWLACIWSNLLLACKECNAYHKIAHFPILGKQAKISKFKDINEFFLLSDIRSKALTEEEHLLIHPVLDDPSDYLIFEQNGTVSPTNNNDKDRKRAEYSIKYYGLSNWDNTDYKRLELIAVRKLIVERIREKLRKALLRCKTDEDLYADLLDIYDDLAERIEEYHPFSAVRRSCLENFKEFFIDEYTASKYEVSLNKVYNRLIENILS